MGNKEMLDRLYENIAFLIRLRDKKISEVELEIGVSVGYL